MLNPDGFSDCVMLTFQSENNQMFLSWWQHPQKDMQKEKNTVDGFRDWGREK